MPPRRKRHLQAEPDEQACPHHFLGAEDIGERATEPRGQRGGRAIGAEDQRHFLRAEVQVDEKRREEAGFDAIADHEQQKAQVADGEAGVHSEFFGERDFPAGLNIKNIAHESSSVLKIEWHCGRSAK